VVKASFLDSAGDQVPVQRYGGTETVDVAVRQDRNGSVRRNGIDESDKTSLRLHKCRVLELVGRHFWLYDDAWDAVGWGRSFVLTLDGEEALGVKGLINPLGFVLLAGFGAWWGRGSRNSTIFCAFLAIGLWLALNVVYLLGGMAKDWLDARRQRPIA